MILKKNKAFTLIELLVVISIISLLSGIVIASLSQSRERARLGSARAFSGQIYRALGASGGFCLGYNEGSGTTVANTSGSETYTILGSNVSTRWTTDTPNNSTTAFSFNRFPSPSNRVSITPTGSMISATTRDYTFASWVKRTAAIPGLIIGQDSFGQSTQIRLNDSGQVIGTVSFSTPTNTIVSLNSPTNLDMGKWYNVALSVDTTKRTIRLFIDGKVVNETTYASNFILRNYGSNAFEVGAFQVDLSNGITADLDDTCLFLDVI